MSGGTADCDADLARITDGRNDDRPLKPAEHRGYRKDGRGPHSAFGAGDETESVLA